MTCTYTASDKDLMYKSFKARNKSHLQELIDFAKIAGFKKLGIANCKSVQPYADKLTDLLKQEGFEVFALNCRSSQLDGCDICAQMQGPSCDPVSQAEFFNNAQTDLNINIGLCLGHGLIFQKHSQAPVTTFLVKDFATGHNSIENLK